MWGVTTGSRSSADKRVRVGDHLLFWVGGRGYTGVGVVTGLPHPPKNKSEAPWPGGVYNFRSVLPFAIQHETTKPLFLPFQRARQTETDLSSIKFQHGLSDLAEPTAAMIVERLLDRDLGEN